MGCLLLCRASSLLNPSVEGVRRAGKNLTPENLDQGHGNSKEWQGIGPPITYSNLNSYGSTGGKACLLRKGQSRRNDSETHGLDTDHEVGHRKIAERLPAAGGIGQSA